MCLSYLLNFRSFLKLNINNNNNNMVVQFCKRFAWRKVSKRYRSYFRILGIESSCDDSSAAVVDSNGKILGQGHLTQARLHIELGGIIPQVATDLHRNYLKTAVESSLSQSCLKMKDLDAIAVTVKPGLILSLKEGLKFAKELSVRYRKPLIPIHHMEAHALTIRMIEEVDFPFLGFLISGGHCILVLVKSIDKFYTLGSSIDSAPGLAMDKVARRAKLKNLKKLSNLVGGAAIEAAALTGDPTAIFFPPRIMPYKNCDFSFSGSWTTAVRYIEKKEKADNLGPDEVISNIYDLCASFQWSVTRHFCHRLEAAIHYVKEKKLLTGDIKCLVVSGGVASNDFIRNALKFVCDHYNYKLLIPPPHLCTDNGAMIAWNGMERLKANFPVVCPENLDSVTPLAKCSLGENISSDVKNTLQTINYTYLKLNKFIKTYYNR